MADQPRAAMREHLIDQRSGKRRCLLLAHAPLSAETAEREADR
jgi:hypothetical protein